MHAVAFFKRYWLQRRQGLTCKVVNSALPISLMIEPNCLNQRLPFEMTRPPRDWVVARRCWETRESGLPTTGRLFRGEFDGTNHGGQESAWQIFS